MYAVPDDFRFKVNGKPMAAKEPKPGMKGEAIVTTKTTINPVTVTEVKAGDRGECDHDVDAGSRQGTVSNAASPSRIWINAASR